jgi:hypothetical protein
MDEVEESADSEVQLKRPEYDRFITIDKRLEHPDMVISPTELPDRYSKYFEKVLLFEKIRETRAFLGFTRVESPREFGEGNPIPRHKIGAISQDKIPKYIPSMINYGEGIFLQFKEDSIREWLKNSEVEKHLEKFLNAEKNWRKQLGMTDSPTKKNWKAWAIYLLVHSFSHAWMRQIALESGYSQASIRERIYVHYNSDKDPIMAGVLVYTASSDSDGTLGGLVQMGKKTILERVIDQALEEAKYCSTDPLCSSHHPEGDEQTPSLNGAACYGCLLSPETSCELSNKWLDRSVISPTIDSYNSPRHYFVID